MCWRPTWTFRCIVCQTRPHIRPSARAGRLRLYDREALALIRHELNSIDAQQAGREGGTRGEHIRNIEGLLTSDHAGKLRTAASADQTTRSLLGENVSSTHLGGLDENASPFTLD